MHCDNLLMVASFSFLSGPEGVEAGSHDAARANLELSIHCLTPVSAGTIVMHHHS